MALQGNGVSPETAAGPSAGALEDAMLLPHPGAAMPSASATAPASSEQLREYSVAMESKGSPVSPPLPSAQALDALPVALRGMGSGKSSRLAKLKPAPLSLGAKMQVLSSFPAAAGIAKSPPKLKDYTAEMDNDSPDSLSQQMIASASQRSSSSEIEELNVQFSAAVSAAASALPSPSARRNTAIADDEAEATMACNEERTESDFFTAPPTFKEAAVVKKRRECHHCHKNNFQDKETCLVCTARYCRNCVLTVMGSMPEGRKCVGCTGQPIHESRRPYLGKPSALLKNLLSSLELQQVLRTEKECPANQLRPEQLFVNGRALNMQAMSVVLGCDHPPSKLRPGRYWYDKSSGYWGKEGEKPSQIISAQLKIGGDLKSDASNGSTQVYINGREITKRELKMLKLAGVQCPQTTYLFLSPDGSYMEEGQNNTKGNIWDKAYIRMMYSLFSLPIPRGTSSRSMGRDASIRYLPSVMEQKTVSKLLLLGHESSGRSTVFKQAKFLYKDGFDRAELETYKEMIQGYLYKYLVNLLEGRERFDEAANGSGGTSGAKARNLYTLETRLKNLADWFLDITADGSLDRIFPAATREYAANVEELWRDPAVQATYRRKEELHLLPDVAGDFLERAVEISSNEYEPADHDILYAEGLVQGSGLAEIEFTLPDKDQLSGAMNESAAEFHSVCRYQLIRVGNIGLSEGKKWLGMFEDVRVVIFCVALSDFDQLWIDSAGVLRNKMLLSKELFEDIVGRQYFKGVPFVLFLSKYDKFEEKITRGTPLTACEWFSDFSPVGVPPAVQAQQAYTYIVHKFKKLVGDRKLYTFQLNALDRNLVASAFQYVKHVLKHEESKAAGWMMLPEESSFCTDLSSYSLHSAAARQENGHSWDRTTRHGTYDT